MIEGAGTVDESVITGESVPAEKGVGAAVTGATVNRTGWFAMRAERVGADTVLAGIVRMVDEATSSKAPIEKLADKISGVFVPVVIAIALITFIIWMFVGARRGDRSFPRDQRARHLVPLRFGARHPDCHHGGDRTRCCERHPREVGRGAADRVRREDGRSRQDRNHHEGRA